ncbi:helix-turn-helix domain-containing protein [Paraburkholderia sp.]|uniref:IclR family transcriptional regulator n=1 Tax=Paraburkholderia sp. TaxID=1926495 RepID=UPI0023843B83|nr:helix-turn-helix domain-containing protein [Paraburkholderia sp.]MDE1180151.1 helix-turn-helix domain-containing protein [Paraburkholderia sp.]
MDTVKSTFNPEPDANADSDARQQRGIQSLDSTGDLLAALVAAGRPLNLRDLAAAAGMPSAKAFAHLVSLQKIGLLARDAAGCYEAGPLALSLGLIGLQRLSPTREAEPEIVELAATTAMSVALAVLGPLGPTVVRLEESARPTHVSLRVGTVMSMVNTAIGRVFAATVAHEVRDGLLADDALRLAGAQSPEIFVAPPSGAAPAGALLPRYAQRLDAVRARGIDTALSKPIPGIDTLAAPVFDHTGNVCLVVALMGPAGSFDSALNGDPATTLTAATQRLSRRFGWMGATPAPRGQPEI